MYLKEVSGIFIDEIQYETVSNNSELNDLIIIFAETTEKELQLYNLEYMESNCTTKEFNDLLESIKSIWELEYPDCNIKYWKTKSNAFFLKWLGVEFKDYC